MSDETNFDIALRAITTQRRNQDLGGGLIGCAVAVCEAFGLDPDAPPSTSKIRVYRDAAGEWRWHQVSRNGRIESESGESYTRRADCVKAARRVASSRPEVIVEEER